MFAPGIGPALQGLQQGRQEFARRAERIASAGRPRDLSAPTFDPVADVVHLQMSRRHLEACLGVIRTADEMLGTLIDTIA